MGNPVGTRGLVSGLTGALMIMSMASGSLAGAQTAAVRDARVVGSVRVRHCSIFGSCRTGGQPSGSISVRMAGRVVATHRYHKGRYSIRLVPGRYALVATLRGAPGRSVTKTVDARAHRSTRVDFVFAFHQR